MNKKDKPLKQYWLQKILGLDENYKIFKTKDDGNCFFHVVHNALKVVHNAYKEKKACSVEDLRKIVSENITEDEFSLINAYSEPEGKYKNIDELKEAVLSKDYWADDVLIAILEKHLGIKMIIFDEDLKNIVCRFHSEKPPDYYIMTNYTNNVHYEMIGYNNKFLFTYDELPEELKLKINTNCKDTFLRGGTKFRKTKKRKHRITRRKRKTLKKKFFIM